MSSINLLPKNIKVKVERKTAIYSSSTISSFLILFSIIISIYYHFEDKKYIQDINSLSSESNLIEVKLEEEINNSRKFIISQTEGENILYMLSVHSYFTKIINYFEQILTDDVFVESYAISIDGDFVNIDFDGVAKNYESAATQMYIIKEMFKAKKVNIEQLTQKNSGINFSGSISFDENIGKYEYKE